LIVIPDLEAAASRFEAPGWLFYERGGRNDDQGRDDQAPDLNAPNCAGHLTGRRQGRPYLTRHAARFAYRDAVHRLVSMIEKVTYP
jgi:hypothetical protein